jgi:hypothetical protein
MRSPSDRSSRCLVIMFSVVALAALGVLTLSWQASLLDRYEFRQLQTALGTFWLAQDGWQLAYLLPLFGPPWSVPMEFPIYQFIVAHLHTLTGYPLEQTGRLVGISFLFASLPAVFDFLAITGLRRSRRLIVLALILHDRNHRPLFFGVVSGPVSSRPGQAQHTMGFSGRTRCDPGRID